MKTAKLIVFLSLAVLFGCAPEDDFGPQKVDDDHGAVSGVLAGKVLIGCEGNFQNSNASISVYDPQTGEVSGSVFFHQNGRELGDVLQSMTRVGNTIALVVNNSAEVIICDASDLSIIGSMTGFTSPRYAIQVGNELWVSDLYSNSIQRFNPITLEQEAAITMNGWTERMARYIDLVYVADLTNREIIAIDANTLSSKSLLQLNFVPRYLETFDSLLVLAGEKGTLAEGSLETVLQLHNLKTGELVFSQEFPEAFANASMDKVEGFLALLISEQVHTVDLLTLESKHFEHDAFQGYGIGMVPGDRDIYVLDAADFISNGWIYRYSFDGSLIDSSNALGYIPQAVLPLF